MATFPCRGCGRLQETMTVPHDWPPDLVAKWRALESRLVCPECEGVAIPLPDED